jgi:hypothetical protein
MCVFGVARANVTIPGSVVCAGTDQGVAGVRVTISQGVNVFSSGWSDATGAFSIVVVAGSPGDWVVDLEVLDASNGAITAFPDFAVVALDYGSTLPLAVASDVAGACAPPPPPVCVDPALDNRITCDRLRTPANECATLGLVPLVKVEGESSMASYEAAAVMIKAAGCYRAQVGIDVGDPLLSPSFASISHVTYCICPPAP